MRILLTGLIVILTSGLQPIAQDPNVVPDPTPVLGPTLTGPPGTYQITAPAAARLIYGPDAFTLSWGDGPISPNAPKPRPPAPPAPPAPETEIEKAARAYAQGILEATAQGWEAAALELEKTATVRDALAKGAQVQYEQRLQSLRKNVTPVFNRVLPEGQEPTTPEQRAAAVKAYRDLATGLRRSSP